MRPSTRALGVLATATVATGCGTERRAPAPSGEPQSDAGERVLVLAIERGRGKFSGAPVEIRHTAHIWTVRDGRAVSLDVNWDRDDALNAVGLEE